MGYTHGVKSDSEIRICTQCKRELPNTNMYFSKSKTGLSAICKECESVKSKERNDKMKMIHNDMIYQDLFYDGTRLCKKCGRELPNNYLYFPSDKTCKDGLRNICRECNPKYSGFLKSIPTAIKWTDEELEILKNNYSIYTNKELQQLFFKNRTIRSIESQASVCGFSGKNQDAIDRANESKAKINSEKLKGRIVSDETKNKLSELRKEYYKTHESHWIGRIVSEEEREMSKQRCKGRWAGDKNPRHINPLIRDSNGRWKGGVLTLKEEFRTRIDEWKKASMEFCNYNCVITGTNLNEIHHTTQFTYLLEKSLNNLNIDIRENIGLYSEVELKSISDELNKLHSIYGYGAGINKKVHKLFHDDYGYINSSPYDFINFMESIKNGKYDKWFESQGFKININNDYFIYLKQLCDSLKGVA